MAERSYLLRDPGSPGADRGGGPEGLRPRQQHQQPEPDDRQCQSGLDGHTQRPAPRAGPLHQRRVHRELAAQLQPELVGFGQYAVCVFGREHDANRASDRELWQPHGTRHEHRGSVHDSNRGRRHDRQCQPLDGRVRLGVQQG